MKSSSIIFTSALFVLAGVSHVSGVAHAATGPTDAQIAHIVVTANRVDIDAGKLAASRGHSADVRAFGKQMVPRIRHSTALYVAPARVAPDATAARNAGQP